MCGNIKELCNYCIYKIPMLKKWFLLPHALALTVSLPVLAFASDVRIGYVDLQKALIETKEGKAAKDRLQRDFSVKQKQLDQAQEEIKRDEEKLKKQSDVLSEPQKRDLQERGNLQR